VFSVFYFVQPTINKVKRLSFLIFFVVPIFFQTASAQYQHLVGKAYAERYKSLDSIFLYKDLFNFDSSKAFKILESIAELGRNGGDDELVLEMKLMKADYYVRGKQKNLAACKETLENLLREVKKQDNKQLRVRTNSSLGAYYLYHKKNPGPALDYCLRAYYLLKDLDIKDFPNKMDIVGGTGGIYYSFGDDETAKKLMLEALSYGPSYKPWFNIAINNNIGFIYQNEGKGDSAIYFFKKSEEIAKDGNNEFLSIKAGGNIGEIYYFQKKYNEAIPLLEANAKACIANNDLLTAAGALLVLGAISLETGNLEKAEEQLLHARSLYAGLSSLPRQIHEIYPLLAKLEAAKGNARLAYKYADSGIVAKDSFYNSSRTLLLSKAQQHTEAERHVAEVQQLADQKHIQVLIRNSLLIGLVLLGGIALLFTNRQKIVHKRKEERLAAEKLLLDTELVNATEQLHMFTKSIHEKNELIEKFEAELEGLQTPGENDLNHNFETITQLRESTILTDDEWEHFRKLFEKVHTGYFERLKDKLPGLSPAETRFLALSKLKMSNKEMAGVLGISTDAVRMNKHRLRKKLNMSEESIDDLVATL
jgi:tetratricopeptide (TPR) repeat protein